MTNVNGNGRKQYSVEAKFKIVKEALTTDQSISELCKKYGISTALFYRWQEIFFESALEGFDRKKKGALAGEIRAVEALKTENNRMKDVIAEIVAENVEFKKKSGGF